MYTVILYIGSKEDIHNYRFWLQDYENAGLGVVLYVQGLNLEEICDCIKRVVKGIECWSMLLLFQKQWKYKLKEFLDRLQALVYNEKQFLLHMPKKVWLIIKSYYHLDKTLSTIKIDSINLPPYCRLIEYMVDWQEREFWKENMKILCIAILFAVNRISSESCVAYRRNQVDIEIDMQEFWNYIKEYKGILYKGMQLSIEINSGLSEAVKGNNIEVIENIPPITNIERSMNCYKGKKGKTVIERNKAYFDMKISLRKEWEYIQKNILERERNLQVGEIELSEEYRKEIMERKQEEEIKIVKVEGDLEKEEKLLEKKRNYTERKSMSIRMLKWDKRNGLEIMGKVFLGTSLLLLIEIIEIMGISFINEEIDKYTLCRVIIGLAIGFSVYTGIILLGQNIFMEIIRKCILDIQFIENKEFARKQRKKFDNYAQLCYEIRKKEGVLGGHKKAVRKKDLKIQMTQKHYEFCISRLKMIEEMEYFLQIGSIGRKDKEEIGIFTTIDIFSEPKKEPVYQMLCMKNGRRITINQAGQTIFSPFLFVKSMTIERDFYI